MMQLVYFEKNVNQRSVQKNRIDEEISAGWNCGYQEQFKSNRRLLFPKNFRLERDARVDSGQDLIYI